MTVPLQAYLLLSAAIFVIGVLTVLLRRGAITTLMGIELMLNAANLAFVAFSRQIGSSDGQIFVLFAVAVAAAEAAGEYQRPLPMGPRVRASASPTGPGFPRFRSSERHPRQRHRRTPAPVTRSRSRSASASTRFPRSWSLS